MTAESNEKQLIATLAVAADAMFVIALLGASRVLVWYSTPSQRWADLACVIALLFGAVALREPRMYMWGFVAIIASIAQVVLLNHSHDIAWLLHGVLIAHLLLLIVIRQPLLWNFTLVLASLLWMLS